MFATQKKLCQAFMRLLADLSKESLILLIGFDCSLGKDSKLSNALFLSGDRPKMEVKSVYDSPKQKGTDGDGALLLK